MTPADWRALLEAFVDRRIGPDAFQRRYIEGWRENRDAHIANPAAIDALFDVVEAYNPDEETRRREDADDDELMQAARRALAQLRAEGVAAGAPRTYDRARAREELRRFQIGLNRLVGFGCLIAVVWIGLCLLQWSAVAAAVQSVLGWSATPAAIAGFILAFIPIVGSVIAFYGAAEVWDWNPWVAGLIFFAAPAATIFSGWMRWWRRT